MAYLPTISPHETRVDRSGNNVDPPDRRQARGRRVKQLHLATCIRETRVNRSDEGHPYTQRSSHLDRDASIRHLLVDGASANFGGSNTNGDLRRLHIGNRAVGVDITAILPSDDQLATSNKPSEISGKNNLDP